MVRILLDDFAQLPAVRVLFAFFVEVERDRCALLPSLRGLDVVPGLPVARPSPGMFFGGATRDHVNAVGHHEGAVEADAELADQVRIALGIA